MIERKNESKIVVLHNLRSTFNVGAIFRTAEAAGFDKIYLAGITPSPPNPKILKVALGAENYLKWGKVARTDILLKKLKKDGFQILALEQHPK